MAQIRVHEPLAKGGASDILSLMKPPKESTLVFEGAQHQLQDPVLVSIAKGSSTRSIVAVEWRDGAGELHYADLFTDANENWSGSLVPLK